MTGFRKHVNSAITRILHVCCALGIIGAAIAFAYSFYADDYISLLFLALFLFLTSTLAWRITRRRAHYEQWQASIANAEPSAPVATTILPRRKET